MKLLGRAAPLIRRQLRSARVALLFGSEKRGLSNADLSHCHWLLRIPTREEHVSMNLGQAVAVCLYELARDAAGPQMPASQQPAREKPAMPRKPQEGARAGELERITSMLVQALRSSGYLGQPPTAAKEEKVRRMVLRLDLSAADAEIWLGMLRQIVWKLERK